MVSKKKKSNGELFRMAEQPDNPQHTGMYSEEMKDAARELRRRGFSEEQVQQIGIGKFPDETR